MKRLSVAVFALVMVLGGIISPVMAAQSAATSVEDKLLTLAEGDGWTYSLDADEQPIEELVPMMVDGEPQLEFAPVVLDMYQQYEMQDAYAWSADMLPANYEPISTTIEIRVMTFSTEENATGFLGAFYDQLVELTPAEANLTTIDPLPNSELNLVGVTSMKEFTQYGTEESMGMAGGVRYLSQIGNAVISVDVAGPLLDYNFDLAYWLLEAQAACVGSDTACGAIPMPMGNSNDANGHWALHENGLGFAAEPGGEYEWARWEFPLESPVAAPEQSVTLP